MTSEKILSAAEELFMEKGFDAVSVREIAGKAGVNVALINYHFQSKENLFLSVLEETVSASRMKLNSLNNADIPSKEKLLQVIDMYTEKIFTNCRGYHFIQRELTGSQRPELVEGIVKITNKNSAELRRLLEDGQKKKEFKKDADVDMVNATLFGVMYQATHAVLRKRWTRPGEDDEAFKQRVKEYLVDLLTGYLIK
jgi:TetR/AcrR family transcriptional regulator, fatty acid metabolism regulator protein